MKPQHNQPPNKIGFLVLQKTGIRLDIDFLPEAISGNDVLQFMRPHSHIDHSDVGSTPRNKSWWRYNNAEPFNTLTLSIRRDDLQSIVIDSPEAKAFFQKVVDAAYVPLGS